MLPTKITHKIVIFTDLDGTLLDANAKSFEPALNALHLIKQNGISLVLSSSKTRAELELYQKKLENEHPFISENGGGIFIPKHYFSFPFRCDRELEKYLVLEMGTPYSRIIQALDSIRKETGISIKGFSDLTERELSSLCNLDKREARAAKQREYDEPFMIEGGEKELEAIKRKIKEKGMNYVWGGRFHHLLGENDKGKAAGILKGLYKIQFIRVSTFGIGNSLNDLPMLSRVDHPILLKEKNVPPAEALRPIQNITVIHGEGPSVWDEVIRTIVSRLKI